MIQICNSCFSEFETPKGSIFYCSNECRKQARFYKDKDQNKKRYHSRQRFLRSVKLTCGCVDCGYIANENALQFDHVRDKIRKVNTCRSYKEMVDELEKCEVRCANCHAIKTWERRQCSTA